jgi:hypothetical protein
MKKLMVLILVLGTAAMANAGLVFTVNGQPSPAEISLNGPSDAISLGIELGSGTIRVYDLVYQLSNAQAELITTGYGQYPATTWPALFDLQGYAIVTNPQKIEVTATQLFTEDLAAPQTLMLNMVLHCLEETDVILTVTTTGVGGNYWDGGEIPPGTVLSTLLIHQVVPEPMTIALLGLGGLFLRRRK